MRVWSHFCAFDAFVANISMEKLLTITELSGRLGITIGTAYHWLSQGRLPCVRFSARCVRFRESDIEKMLEELKRGPIGPQGKNKRKRLISSSDFRDSIVR